MRRERSANKRGETEGLLTAACYAAEETAVRRLFFKSRAAANQTYEYEVRKDSRGAQHCTLIPDANGGRGGGRRTCARRSRRARWQTSGAPRRPYMRATRRPPASTCRTCISIAHVQHK